MAYAGYWKLRTNSTDFVGSNNGTDTAMTYSLGHAKFNGTTSKITTSYTFPNGANNKSMALSWMSNDTNDRGWLVAGGTDNNGEAFGNFIQDIDGCYFHGNGGAYDATISSAYPLNVWNRTVITYDGTNLRGYLNGVLAVTKAMTLNTTNGVAQTWFGGRKNSDANGWFAGKLRDIITTSAVLAAQAIKTDYMLFKGKLQC